MNIAPDLMTHRARGCPFIANVDGEDFVIDGFAKLGGINRILFSHSEKKKRLAKTLKRRNSRANGVSNTAPNAPNSTAKY